MDPAARMRKPDLVVLFRAFGRLVARSLPADSGPREVACTPLPSGGIRLRFADSAGRMSPLVLVLSVTPADAHSDVPDCAFGELFVEDADHPDAAVAVDAVTSACDQVRRDPRFAPLRVVSRVPDVPGAGGHVMDRILARRLQIGESRCGGFVLFEVDEEIGRLCRLSFADPDRGDRVDFLLLGPAAAPSDATMAAGPFRLVVVHRAGSGGATECLDESSLSNLPPPAQTLCQVVRFLLARALHPAFRLDGAWIPAAPDGRADERVLGGRDGLNASTMPVRESWRRFFVPFEAERDLWYKLPARDGRGRIRHLVQCELECLYIQPRNVGCARFHRPLHRGAPRGPVPRERPELWATMADSSRVAPVATPAVSAAFIAEVDEAEPSLLMTDREVILGGAGLLETRLAWERARAREGDILVLNETCVPRIIGEDLARLKREHRALGGAPIIDIDITQPGPIEMLAKQIGQLRDSVLERIPAGALEVQEDHVALVGYPEDGSLEELAALAGLLGLRVTAAFLPSMDRDALLAVMRSRYVVCNPGPAWGTIVRRVLARAHTRILSPPLPYGFTGVRRFLEALADAASRSRGDWAPRVDALVDGLRVAVPASLGVAYVVDLDEARRLALATGNFGVPALPFLEELGFAQTVLVHRASPDDGVAEVEAVVRGALVEGDRVRVLPFTTIEELRESLSASDAFQVIYSQMTFDRRLYACGKAAFSMADLECGLWGAHRTANRLVERCRWAGPARIGPWIVEPGWNA